jgi:hypothetical protein
MNSIAVIKAAMAIAQVDREVSPEEIEILDNLIDMENVGPWEKKELMNHLSTKVDLKTAVDSIVNEDDRKYTLALCFTMALAGGISPPESDLIRRIAARWSYNDEILNLCLIEGKKVYDRLKGSF